MPYFGIQLQFWVAALSSFPAKIDSGGQLWWFSTPMKEIWVEASGFSSSWGPLKESGQVKQQMGSLFLPQPMSHFVCLYSFTLAIRSQLLLRGSGEADHCRRGNPWLKLKSAECTLCSWGNNSLLEGMVVGGTVLRLWQRTKRKQIMTHSA